MQLKVPHPIPYQGSKRWIADTICECIPAGTRCFFEPFAGSAAVTLAAAAKGLAEQYFISDIHEPLAKLWQAIIDNPRELADNYERLWTEQIGQERTYYDDVRRQFNQDHLPEHFLYLLARCVKAAIRYNSKGEFNNSPDNRRLGAEPGTMRWHLMHASKLLQKKAAATCEDFRSAIAEAAPDDVIFMDPPYQGVGKERDSRYVQCLTFDAFSHAVRDMVSRNLSFIISYDGRTGDKRHGQLLPTNLGLLHFEVAAGKSTTETLLGRCAVTYESIYLSRALVNRLARLPSALMPDRAKESEQLSLFAETA